MDIKKAKAVGKSHQALHTLKTVNNKTQCVVFTVLRNKEKL